MKRLIYIFTLAFFLIAVHASARAEMHVQEFSGVVTFHLVPAKVIKINQIIENPEPGTSYIGEEGILVEVEENPNVMANWTVVKIKYFEYHEPKTIKYEILSEPQEITVKYHATSLEVDGDMSRYIK